MMVSKHPSLIEFAKGYRNYGKPAYDVQGLNFRMSEFTAALGVVQVDRMEEIVAWKQAIVGAEFNPKFPHRVQLPDGMTSGWYKYIVFDPIERSSGKVYDTLCHTIMKSPGLFPNAEWIAQHHWCVPLYYHPETERTS